MALAVALVLVAAGGFGVYALGNTWLQDLPEYDNINEYNTAGKTRVYANDGTTLLAEFYVENREPVNTNQISDYVLKGTVATEDERFYSHDGVDLWGIARAFVVNLTGSSREGASTITQQFVRATILSGEANEISFKRKVREAYISLKLEEQYSKDEILLMYLNTINYGSGAYGIEAAAQTYYSKNAKNLTIAEAATLIGIPQSPTYNNPVDNPQTCLERRNVVLERMLRNNVITQAEYETALATPLSLNMKQTTQDGIYNFPYFTSYVRDLLLEKYSMNEVFKGGLTVITTIDPAMQLAAEESARNKEARIPDDLEVALTAVDPNTGYIKAMVGGKDFYADQYNLATQAKRSPGSSFKTFTLITALEAGIAPTTNVSCSATVKLDDWQVENYGKSEYGTRPISSAFAVSSNTAFARLITALTPTKVVETAQRMGIETQLSAVPSLTLGSNGVTTVEMAGAYATIANGGTHHKTEAIEKIVDRNGKVVYQADTTGNRAITPEVAAAATDVMKGVVTSGTGTEAALRSGQVAAGKTGTSENWHDSYFCGITPQISVAIWVGSRQERQMPEWVTATSVFSDFVGTVLSGQPLKDFPKADNPPYKPYSNTELAIGGSAPSPQPAAPVDQNQADQNNPPPADTTTPDTGGTTGGTPSGSGSSGSGSGGSGGSGGASP